LDATGRPDPVREIAADTGTEGEDGLLDRYPSPALDPWGARDRRGDRRVARVFEAAEHVPRTAAFAHLGDGRPPAYPLQPDRRLDRTAVDVESQPARNPDPDGAGQGDSLCVRPRTG